MGVRQVRDFVHDMFNGNADVGDHSGMPTVDGYIPFSRNTEIITDITIG